MATSTIKYKLTIKFGKAAENTFEDLDNRLAKSIVDYYSFLTGLNSFLTEWQHRLLEILKLTATTDDKLTKIAEQYKTIENVLANRETSRNHTAAQHLKIISDNIPTPVGGVGGVKDGTESEPLPSEEDGTTELPKKKKKKKRSIVA